MICLKPFNPVTVLALTLFALGAPVVAQGPPQGVPWVGKPLKRALGLNNGLSKILLEVQGKKGTRTHFNLRFRDTDKGLHEKVFRSVPALTPDRITYTAGGDFDSEGNKWFQHEFTNGDAKIHLCLNLKSIGKVYFDHLTKLGYVIDPRDLPFALMILISPQGKTPYILRDLSAYRDPETALLNDEVPLEAASDWTRVMIYYQQRLEKKNPKIIIDALECLCNLPGHRVRILTSQLLRLRESKNTEIAGLATELCRLNGFYSESDITKAIASLSDTNQKIVRRNVLFLRDRGLKAKRRAVPAFEELLKRKNLSEELRKLTTSALAKLQALKRGR